MKKAFPRPDWEGGTDIFTLSRRKSSETLENQGISKEIPDILGDAVKIC